MSGESGPLETIEHGDVVELRLARPPVNALDGRLIGALQAAVQEAGARARALVLSGREGMFSAGLDVPALMACDRAAIFQVWENFFGVMRALAASPIPTAAAITGHSPAGGAVLALFCDYRVMAEGPFKIGLNEVQVGIPIPPIILTALIRVVGQRRAALLATTGALIPASEAFAVGLVDALATPGETVEAALRWCRQTLELPPSAVALTRRLVNEPLVAAFDAVDVEQITDVWFGEETQTTLGKLVERLRKG